MNPEILEEMGNKKKVPCPIQVDYCVVKKMLVTSSNKGDLMQCVWDYIGQEKEMCKKIAHSNPGSTNLASFHDAFYCPVHHIKLQKLHMRTEESLKHVPS